MKFSGQKIIEGLSEHQLSEVIKQIPGDQMSRFVVECLKIPEPTYTQITKTEHGAVYETLLQCMIIWRNKLECQGQDAVKKLELVQQIIRDKYSQSTIPSQIPEQVLPTADSK